MVVIDSDERHCPVHSKMLQIIDSGRRVGQEDPRMYAILFGACPLAHCDRVRVFHDEDPTEMGHSYMTSKMKVGAVTR